MVCFCIKRHHQLENWWLMIIFQSYLKNTGYQQKHINEQHSTVSPMQDNLQSTVNCKMPIQSMILLVSTRLCTFNVFSIKYLLYSHQIVVLLSKLLLWKRFLDWQCCSAPSWSCPRTAQSCGMTSCGLGGTPESQATNISTYSGVHVQRIFRYGLQRPFSSCSPHMMWIEPCLFSACAVQWKYFLNKPHAYSILLPANLQWYFRVMRSSIWQLWRLDKYSTSFCIANFSYFSYLKSLHSDNNSVR